MKKRLLSMLLILCMVISILPMSVLAAGTPAVTVYRSPIVDPYDAANSTGSVSPETLAAWKAAICGEAGVADPAAAEIYYYVASIATNPDLEVIYNLYPDCYIPIDFAVNAFGVTYNSAAGFGYQATVASSSYKDTEKVRVVCGADVVDVDVTVIGALETTWTVEGVTETSLVEIGAVPAYPGNESAIVRFLKWDPQPVAPTTTNVAVPLDFTAKISSKDVEYIDTEIIVEGVDASNNVTITYGEEANLAASVEVNGAVIALDVPSTSTLPVGTHSFEISYPGASFEGSAKDTVYRSAEVVITVTVAKSGSASVAVDNAVVKYGTAVNPADLIHSGAYNTIDILAGLDAHQATKPTGVVSVAMPGGALLCQGMGIDPTNVSIDELKALIHELNGSLPVNEATVLKVINTVVSFKNVLEAKQDIINPQIKIEVVDELAPVDQIGAYLLASAIYDVNYETEMGAGYIVITPDGEKVTLKWNYNDPNYVVTLNGLTGIDLGASVASGDAAAQKHVETLFIGVDQNITDGLKEGVFVGRTLPADAYPGVYMEIAMIADWGNEMYYSEPIVRPIVVAPNAADVKFIDENGNANNLREYIYDGTPKALTVTVDGVENPEAGELKVRYIGIDGHATLKGLDLTTELSKIYDGPEAAAVPTEAGIYLVVAVYADKDDSNGKLIKAGGSAAVLVIRPAAPEFALTDTFKVYDGNEHFSEMTNPKNLDHLKIAVNRETNEAYVELPADYEQFVAMLPAELEGYVSDFITYWEVTPLTTEFIQSTATAIINDALIPADLTGTLMTELNNLADTVSAKIASAISTYGEKAENYAESKVIAKLKAELAGRVPAEYIDLLAKAIEFDGTSVSVAERESVISKTQAASKALITKYAGSEVDALVQGKIDDVIAEVVTAVYTHEEYGIDHLVDVVNYAIARLSALEVDDAEKVLKLSLAVASKIIDVNEVLNAVELVITKVIEAGYVDYLNTMISGLDAIYDVEIDGLKNAVLGLKPMIASMVSKMTSATGDITEADIRALEKQLDEEILPELLAIIMDMPADGVIYLNQMPTEVGTYDTFAINISANYAPVIAQAELVIGIEGWELCEHNWSDWTTVTKADCENDGSKTRTCSLCGAKQTDIIPALDHDYVATVTEPTCTEKGYTTWTCSRCGDTYTDTVVEAMGHDYAEIDRKEATCTDEGYVEYECSRCDDTYREILNIDDDAHYPGCPHEEEPKPEDPEKPEKPDHRCWGPCCDMDFDDVKPSHWFYDDVHYVYCTGLMKGISKDLFGPDMTTTRGMIVTILYRMEGEPRVKTDCQFTDVADGMYYEDPITWAAANGIVTGYDADTFGPDDAITREQMAAILYRYADYKNYSTSDRADLSVFTDAGKVSAYAVEAMSWAVAEGLINGMGDGTVAPQGNALRAQAAALLHRYCVKVADMPEKYQTEGYRHYR